MYFTFLASNNQPGNQLQKEALTVLRNESNLLIQNPDTFIDNLRKRIWELNWQYNRCKPLELYTYGYRRDDPDASIGISLGSNYTVSFKLYPVKNGGGK